MINLPLRVLLGFVWKNWPKGVSSVSQSIDGKLTLTYPTKTTTTKRSYPLAIDFKVPCSQQDFEEALKYRVEGDRFYNAITTLAMSDEEQAEVSSDYFKFAQNLEAIYRFKPHKNKYKNRTREELERELYIKDSMVSLLMGVLDCAPTADITSRTTRKVEAVAKPVREYSSLRELVGTEFRLFPAANEMRWPFWVCQNPLGFVECLFTEDFSLSAESLTLKELWQDLNFGISAAKRPQDIYIRKLRKPRKYTLAKGATCGNQIVDYVPSSELMDLYKEFHRDNNPDRPEPLFRSKADKRKEENGFIDVK